MPKRKDCVDDCNCDFAFDWACHTKRRALAYVNDNRSSIQPAQKSWQAFYELISNTRLFLIPELWSLVFEYFRFAPRINGSYQLSEYQGGEASWVSRFSVEFRHDGAMDIRVRIFEQGVEVEPESPPPLDQTCYFQDTTNPFLEESRSKRRRTIAYTLSWCGRYMQVCQSDWMNQPYNFLSSITLAFQPHSASPQSDIAVFLSI
jgi:hypothetical protein